MEITRLHLNHEDLEKKLEDANEAAENEMLETKAPEEVPEDIESLNPIEQDQAIEIANNHPTPDELDGYTNYEKIIKLSDHIEDNSIENEEKVAVGAMLGQFNLDVDPMQVVHEAMSVAYSRLGYRPLGISIEDITYDPMSGANILKSEQQLLRKTANNTIWSTIKEDCHSIIELIDTINKTIVSKKETISSVLEKIRDGEVLNREQDLTQNLNFVGSLRYFIGKKDGRGDMNELFHVLQEITNEQSPKLGTEDNSVFKAISANKTNSLLDAVNHIRHSMKMDYLNLRLIEHARRNPDNAPYEFYSRVTGKHNIDVLMPNGTKQIVEVKDDYNEFLFTTDGIDMGAFRTDLEDTISKFPIRFNNHFLIFKKKYEAIEEAIKPLVMPGDSLEDNVRYEEISKTLSLIRYYYIELVKDRLIDKLNAFHALLELSNRIFKLTK